MHKRRMKHMALLDSHEDWKIEDCDTAFVAARVTAVAEH